MGQDRGVPFWRKPLTIKEIRPFMPHDMTRSFKVWSVAPQKGILALTTTALKFL